jgi:ankyrin repeat protein
MLSLPAEICYDFSRYLNHRDYTRLRRTCKFLSRLDSIQYLYFQSYKDSADSIGNDPELLSQALLSQIRLDNQCLDDDSFLYMAINGHSAEFIRLFQTNACVNISTKAKDEAFIEIIENFNSKDMICELLRDGLVNATLSVTLAVPFSVIAEDEEDEELHNRGTALHWACINGYVDVVQLLLKYDNVDVSSKDNHDNAPIHYAADVGHTESFSF